MRFNLRQGFVSTGMGDLQSKLLTCEEAKKRKKEQQTQHSKRQKLLQAERPKLIDCAPAVHRCFEIKQPWENAVAELCPHVWPLALDQLCCGELSALDIVILPHESFAGNPTCIACCYHDGPHLCALELVRKSQSRCIPGVLTETRQVFFGDCRRRRSQVRATYRNTKQMGHMQACQRSAHLPSFSAIP